VERISFGLVMLFGTAIVSLLWPRPDIPGGWCGSGAAAVQDQYTVTTVAHDALAVTLIVAPCVVVAAAVLPRSFPLRSRSRLGNVVRRRHPGAAGLDHARVQDRMRGVLG